MFLAHPAVHGGEIAGSYTAGEIAPQSPDREKWDIWWFYATGGPGVFKGDVYYYSVDHDSRGIVASMTDTPPIYFMTGEYDGACHPAMSKAASEAIANSAFLEMKHIGPFPDVRKSSVVQEIPDARAQGSSRRRQKRQRVPLAGCEGLDETLLGPVHSAGPAHFKSARIR